MQTRRQLFSLRDSAPSFTSLPTYLCSRNFADIFRGKLDKIWQLASTQHDSHRHAC